MHLLLVCLPIATLLLLLPLAPLQAVDCTPCSATLPATAMPPNMDTDAQRSQHCSFRVPSQGLPLIQGLQQLAGLSLPNYILQSQQDWRALAALTDLKVGLRAWA